MPLFNFTLKKNHRTRVIILRTLIIFIVIVFREDSVFFFFVCLARNVIIMRAGIVENKWKKTKTEKKKKFRFRTTHPYPHTRRIDNDRDNHKDIKQNCDHLTVNLPLIFFFHAGGTPTKGGIYMYTRKTIIYETKTDFSYFFFENLI